MPPIVPLDTPKPTSNLAPPPRRKWKRWTIFLTLLALTVTGWLVYRHYTSPEQIRAMAARALHDATGAEVKVGNGEFELSGTLILHDLSMSVPGMRGQASRLLDAPVTVIHFNSWALLRGRFDVTQVTMLQPVTIYVTEDLVTGRYGFQNLQPKPGELRSPRSGALPQVTITQADVVLGLSRGEEYEETQRISLSGDLSTTSGTPGYQFVLKQLNADRDPAPQIGGTLNLDKLTFTAWLDHFSFAGWQRHLIPHNMRDWWDRLEPTGEIPVVRIGYHSDPRVGIYAEFDVRQLEINLPLESAKVRSAIDEASVAINRDGIRISNLKGRVEDIEVVAREATVWGFESDAPFSLDLSVKGEIPHKPPLVDALPRVLRKTLDRFGPVGDFAATLKSRRARPGEAPEIDARVTFTASHMLDQENPYPMTDVRGELDITHERLTMKIDARGPTGAVITVDGLIAPPMEDRPAFDFHIRATDVPMDEHAWGTLSEKQTRVVEGIFDKEKYAALVEAGLIHTVKTKAAAVAALAQAKGEAGVEGEAEAEGEAEVEAEIGAEAAPNASVPSQLSELEALAARPVFEMGGKLDAEVRFLKEGGPGKKSTTTVTIDMAGLNVLVTPWPYPLTLEAGQLVLAGRSTKLDGIVARGVAGGRGTLHGVFEPSENDDARILPNLTFNAADMPVDALLVASLPDGRGQWVTDFALTGLLDFEGRIFPREDGPGHTFSIATHLRNAKATPFAGSYILDNLTARLLLKPEYFTIEAFDATHGDTALSLGGRVLWQDRRPKMDLTINARALSLSDPVSDLLPPGDPEMQQAREMLATYKPQGIVDLALRFNTDPDDPRDKFNLQLSPQSLAFTMPDGARVSFSEASGDILVTPGVIKLGKFAGTLGAARVGLNGEVRTGDTPAADLTIDAAAPRIDDAMLAVLPAQVAATIRNLEAQGGYAIQGAKLTFAQDPKGLAFDFAARIDLDDASAVVGVPASKIKGVLDIATSQKAGDPDPQLSLTLDAQEMRLLDRLLAPARVELQPLGRDNLYALRTFQGKIYGGTVTGDGNLKLGKDGWYRLKLAMEDVALEPMTHPEHDEDWRVAMADVAERQAWGEAPSQENYDIPTGVISASLNIDGQPGVANSKRGRGEINIRQAKVYQVPLVMTMLQLINLSLPGSGSFDRVAVRYVVEGDTVRFEHLSFEAQNVQIAGSGTMDFPTHKLDLELYSRNPRFRLGVLSDAYDMIKNELVMIKVQGTLEEPKARVEPLSNIKRSIGDIFGQPSDDTKPPLKPNR